MQWRILFVADAGTPAMRPIAISALLIGLLLPGCAGARITPAVNKAETTQTSSGPTERITVSVGTLKQQEAKR